MTEHLSGLRTNLRPQRRPCWRFGKVIGASGSADRGDIACSRHTRKPFSDLAAREVPAGVAASEFSACRAARHLAD